MPYLAFNLNDVNEFVFDILEERLSIGRDAKNDIVIDNTCISGSHAEFLRKPDGVYELVDLKSANGTFVNGRRIQRSLVKGGDKIRFGQLDARFREQAPKGTAPASGSKPSSQPKASPAHSDGRRGDTEPKRDTSPIEPARSFQTLREGAAAAAPSAGSLSIAIPSSATLDLALLKQREKLAAEVRWLRQERDLLRSETENQIRLREEVRAMESSLDERRKEAQAADARLAETRAATMEYANRYSIINSAADARLAETRAAIATAQAEAEKLASKKRDVADLDSQIESKRTQLSKVQADIETANTAFQSLHTDADKARNDRLEAEKQLADLHTQIQQHEAKNLRELEVSKADARLAELKAQTANYESRLSELASMEKNLAETKAAWIAAGQEQESLKIEAERLQRERADHEKRLLDLQTELVNAQSELKTQLIELETSQASAKELAERVSALEDLETQLIQAEKRLEEVRRDITLQMTVRDGVSALVLTLFSQRAEHENLLPKLRADVQVLKTELQTLTQDKNSIMVALERVQADRHAALEQTESLLAESANLQERLTEKRDTLEAEIKARLAETNQAEARLIEITAKVAASEKRVSDLAVAQEQLTECQNALKETEVRRHAEEKALAELVKQQDRLRNELFTLEDGIRAGTGAVNDLTTKIKS
jgi:chromosome segregation ATPase